LKLWQKEIASLKEVETFTIGKDREMDLLLAPYDVMGSIAHVKMLATIAIISQDEEKILVTELQSIYKQTLESAFTIGEGIEDIHSHIEFLLTNKLGDVGKKIHAARSRNDQVLVDIKLYLRNEIAQLAQEVVAFFHLLQAKSEEFKSILLPGYTHLQLAMPSSFGLWFGAYAEALVDDMISLQATYKVVNKNPLGSAAGYGSSFPINRTLTTALLGFDTLNYNVVYAQMGRGKAERITAQSLANIADTLARLSMDMCLYLNQNFGFVSFPDQLTTGSSIMPHKKNPDVFELIRSYCNRIKSLPNEIMLMTTNLPSGYHRDLQLLKEHLFPAFSTLKECIKMATLMLSNISVKEDIVENEQYKYLFSVEEVNKFVLSGIPFRDAYKKVSKSIEENSFEYNTHLHHTHEGSIGNLCNSEIKQLMVNTFSTFEFEKVETAIHKLVNY